MWSVPPDGLMQIDCTVTELRCALCRRLLYLMSATGGAGPQSVASSPSHQASRWVQCTRACVAEHRTGHAALTKKRGGGCGIGLQSGHHAIHDIAAVPCNNVECCRTALSCAISCAD